MTDRIDHAKIASDLLDPSAWVQSSGEPVSDDVIAPLLAKAQVHATLALVEQQRIANLIAWHSSPVNMPRDARREARKALGLND